MTTTAVYKNPAYLVTYGDKDFIELDIEINIIKDVTSYRLEIIRAELNPLSMQFALSMYNRLNHAERYVMDALFRELLIKDLEPHLFSLYHTGDLLHGTDAEAV